MGPQPPLDEDVPDGGADPLRRKFKSPNLESLLKILLMFIADHSCNYYFKRMSPQATAFQNSQATCKVGWKTEVSRKKKWTVRFVA